MKNLILHDLIKVEAVNEKNIEVFSDKTRDNKNLEVKRDTKSSVIFIEDFYIGNEEYVNGNYKEDTSNFYYYNFEDESDSIRRFNEFKKHIVNKDICDYGFGKGSFLKLSKDYAKSLTGIEYQENYITELQNFGVNCYNSLKEVKTQFDSIFLFHVFEHLPQPLLALDEIKQSIKDGGKIIIEVPHAKDVLFENNNFKDFTLWSQHLILHTRVSLELFLKHAGFKDIYITSCQRFGLSNHIKWYQSGLPGGHYENSSIFEDNLLQKSYADALARIDKSDTLIAIASK